MKKERLCIIGMPRELFQEVRKAWFGPLIYHELVPKIAVKEGQLFVERSKGIGMLPVDRVVYYGIFENDFDLLTGLAIWGGPCWPNAMAMMNCRLKLPCLARALQYSAYNSPRGFVSPHTEVSTDKMTVAKWGNWHCGENKHRFTGQWQSEEASVIEPFFAGDAVRIALIGSQAWQIKLEGEDWLKSLHSPQADFMPIDEDLLADTKKVKEAFGLDLIANDYIVQPNGDKHLLEVNHIPNVTRFEPLAEAYVQVISEWISIRV